MLWKNLRILSGSFVSASVVNRSLHPFARVSLIATAIFGSSSVLLAQRDLTDIPVPNPEVEKATFQMGDGWTAELFAGDAQLAKPIHMNWDNHGRLWVACSETYPQISPGVPANDKILILEDVNRDGVAEKTTVFADGLLIPTGVLPGNDGPHASAYVVNSDKLVYMVDKDGDLVADEKTVVLSGFGTEDTHHLLHSLRWGHDGWLYMNQSIYIHSHIETPWGVERLNGGGIWRYHPSTKQLEVVARGFVNPWGVHFDRYGQMFATDGAYTEGINYVFPGSVFVTAVGGTRFLGGLNPGSPKHCGLEILSGSHWPDSIRGSMIANDFRAHRVCRFSVQEDRSGYESIQQQELIKTSHVSFRPIDAKQGLDGHLYIADWYNPIIQHGEVDFRDPRRDRTHGRIWRLTHKNQSKVDWKPIDSTVPASQLLSMLSDDSDLVRLFATQALRLQNHDSKIPPSLTKDIDKLQWLWLLEGKEIFDRGLQEALLASADGRIRAAVWRSLRNQLQREIRMRKAAASAVSADEFRVWLARAQAGIRDTHPRVRLEALRLISLIAIPESASAACLALDQPMDRFLDFAAWQTLRDLKPYWLETFSTNSARENPPLNGNAKHIAFAMRAIQDPASVDALLRLLVANRGLQANDRIELMQLVAELGNPAQQSSLLESLLSSQNSEVTQKEQVSLIASMLDMSKRRKQRVPLEGKGLELLIAASQNATNLELRGWAIRALGQWQVASQRPQLTALLTSDISEVRAAAVIAIASFQDADAKTKVLDATRDKDLSVSATAIEQLVELDLNAACQAVVQRLDGSNTDENSWRRILSILLGKKDGARNLADLISQSKQPVSPETGRMVRSIIRSSGADASKLIEAIEQVAKLKENRWVWSESLRDRWIATAKTSGDPVRGEQIYRRTELQCVQCHKIGGVGGAVGPDLSSIGAQAPADYLVEALIAPAAKVKEGYHAKLIRTEDDEVVTGIPIGESDNEVIIRGADGKERTLLKSSIAESKDARSLMPDGLLDSLSESEAVDLLRFMVELGRIDGVMLVKDDGTIRNWQSLTWTPQANTIFNRNSLDAIGSDSASFVWQDASALVSGKVSLQGLASYQPHAGMEPTTFLQSIQNVSRAGKLVLDLGPDAKKGFLLWVQGIPTPILSSKVEFDVAEGPLRLHVGLKRESVGSAIQVRVDRESSTARLGSADTKK